MVLQNFPESIWVRGVGPFLSRHDILSLRLVNKKLCHILSSNQIWFPIVKAQWFQYGEILEYNGKIENFLQYYVGRKKLDTQFEQLLLENDTPQICQMLSTYEYLFMPILLDVVQRSDLRISHLSAVYEANEIIKLLSYGKIYETMSSVWLSSMDLFNYEEVLLAMNRYDPSYYSLILHRNTIRDKLFSEYQGLIFSRDYIDLLLKNRSTKSVILIIKIFNKLVARSKSKDKFSKGKSLLNQPFFVLPVYHGVSSSSWAKSVIISSICQELALDVKITKEGMLRVTDSHYLGGYSYLFLQGNEIVVMKYETFKLRVPVSNSIGRVVTSRELLRFCLERAWRALKSESNLSDTWKYIHFLLDIDTRLGDLAKTNWQKLHKDYDSSYLLHYSKLNELLTRQSNGGSLNQIKGLPAHDYNVVFPDNLLKSDCFFTSDKMELFDAGDVISRKSNLNETYIVLFLSKRESFDDPTDLKTYYHTFCVQDGQLYIFATDSNFIRLNLGDDLIVKTPDVSLGLFFRRFDENSHRFVLNETFRSFLSH